MKTKPVLVIGGTGYVGGRLIPRLLEAGYRVRAMVRSLEKLKCRPWSGHSLLEAVEGDVLDLESFKDASQGCWAAVYLVHSMVSASSGKFPQADRTGASNMVVAAAAARLDRIIYLGGLGSKDDPALSEHLKSRHEVAQILQSGPVPVTFLRAAMILGSGSASFEMLRYLVERLPIMLTPPWVRTLVQPIAIRNVLHYLQGCLEQEASRGETFDIGGPDVLTYEDLIQIYAEVCGLPKRVIIPISFLTPHMSAFWIHMMTPIPSSIALPLAEGLQNEVVCGDTRIHHIIPQRLLTCRETIELAVKRVEQHTIETCWTDAGEMRPPEWTYCGDADYSGGTILECGSRIQLRATPEEIWDPISKIGGPSGWYFANPLWSLRGWVDRLVGGTGMNRGRRDPAELHTGDALDFYRVLDARAPHHLVLLSEMKTPGESILEFKITPVGEETTELEQLSRFVPRGLAGLVYWYGLFLFHEWLFGGMVLSIARKTGKPIIKGPERFTPRIHRPCGINPRDH